MFPLSQHFHQALLLQPLEVHARGRRRHLRDHGKLRTSARAPIDQAVKHSRAARLTDGRGNSGDPSVRIRFDIHTLMLNEVSMTGKHHTARHAPSTDQTSRREAIGGMVVAMAATTAGYDALAG